MKGNLFCRTYIWVSEGKTKSENFSQAWKISLFLELTSYILADEMWDCTMGSECSMRNTFCFWWGAMMLYREEKGRFINAAFWAGHLSKPYKERQRKKYSGKLFFCHPLGQHLIKECVSGDFTASQVLMKQRTAMRKSCWLHLTEMKGDRQRNCPEQELSVTSLLQWNTTADMKSQQRQKQFGRMMPLNQTILLEDLYFNCWIVAVTWWVGPVLFLHTLYICGACLKYHAALSCTAPPVLHRRHSSTASKV